MDFIRIKNKPAVPVKKHAIAHRSNPSKLINKGKYGCIYKPGIRCSGKPWPVKYVSKIQLIRQATSRETIIGKDLRKSISNFSQYFAPILSSCPIDISVIDKQEVRKCDVIQDNIGSTNARYSSNKIRYVGKMTLGDFLLDAFVKRPNEFMKDIVHTHQYLLKSIGLMESIGLVHYDLKENNIIYDHEQSAPIIIDFGLAFFTSDLDGSSDGSSVGSSVGSIAKQYFYDSYEKYPPWCFDTVLLSHIADMANMSNVLTNEDIVLLKQRLQTFIEKNDAVRVPFISDKERSDFMIGWSGYLDGFLGKSWNDLWKLLFSQNMSWDNYSVCVIYFMIMEQFSDLFLNESAPLFVQSYISLLKRVVLWVPGTGSNRLTALTMKSDFSLIFKGVKGKEYADFNVHIETVSRDKNRLAMVAQNFNKFSLGQLEDSALINND